MKLWNDIRTLSDLVKKRILVVILPKLLGFAPHKAGHYYKAQNHKITFFYRWFFLKNSKPLGNHVFMQQNFYK